MRRSRAWIAVGCLWAVLAFGAKKEIKCTIDAGFSGVVPKAGTLVPVTVVIDNTVANTTGQILAVQREGPTFEVTHVLDFNSPVGSNKKYVMLVRSEPGRELQVRVVFDGSFKTIEKSEFQKPLDKDLVLCAGLPQQQVVLLSTGDPPYRFLRLRERDLPEDPLAYDGIHSVVLGGSDLSQLTGQQQTALHQWLVGGGQVILVDPEMDSKLFLLNYGHLAPGAPAADQTGIFHVGAGILALGGTTSSATEPFWYRNGKPVLKYVSVLFPRLISKDDSAYGAYADDGIFRSLVPTGGSYGLSGFVWLAVIIAAYILVIGPVDYWVCKKTGKPHLTWVIFLGAIAGFSFLAYWYSTLVHSGSMQAVYVNIVDVGSGQTTGTGKGLFWLYSTKNRTYDIAVPDIERPVFSARESPSGSSGVAGVTVVHGDGAFMKARIPIFSSKFFDATWLASFKEPFTASEEQDGVHITAPAGRKVAAAFLADADGLTILQPSATPDVWRLSTRQTWQGLLGDLVSTVSDTRNRYNYNQRREVLPDRNTLIRYAQWISFAHRPPKTDDKDDESVPGGGSGQVVFTGGGYTMGGYSDNPIEDALARMDDTEEELVIMRRVAANGRVLLLVLAPENDLFPVHFTSSPVDVARIDVVRLQLADAP